MKTLAEFLRAEHLAYCHKIGRVVNEVDWVRDELNPRLQKGDQLAYPSINSWMNEMRLPDARNWLRLIKVFGPQVITYMGVEFQHDLELVIRDWPDISSETRTKIVELVRASKDEREPLLA